MKTLIVEDNNASQILMKLHLKEISECVCAENGQEALDLFVKTFTSNNKFDLICLDINMPEMDGHEFLKNIRQYEVENNIPSTEAVKVIMTSALGDPHNVVTAYKAGCEDYIVKPVKKSELLKKIEELGLDIHQKS